MKTVLEQGSYFSTLTPFQRFRAYSSGKRTFFAVKEDQIRVVLAFSKEDAQKKFTGWDIIKGGE